MANEQNVLDMRSVAIYCRVSTDEQAREGLSLNEQQHRLEAYCAAMGWKGDIRLFIDDGYSAKDLNRPQLTHLLESVRNNEISKIIVTKLDRLSRRLLNLLELIDEFQTHTVSFISISESFDTNTPSGRLTLQVLGAVAEFERERIRERVVDNMFHAANQGKWLTSAPYGYKLIEKKLEVHPEQAKVVKRIFKLYLQEHMGFLTIARTLNEEGIPSPSGKEWWNRTIKLILTNPVYKGTTVWNRRSGSIEKRPEKDLEEWVIQEKTHEAIIPQETWDKVQESISQKSLPSRAQSSTHLLSGLLKCPKCGSGMSVSTSGSRKNPYKAYRCSAHKNKGGCTGKQYKLDEMHTLFKKGLEDLLTHLPIETIKVNRGAASNNQSTITQQKIHTAKKRYERKVEAFTAGLISLEDLRVEKERLETLQQVAGSREKEKDLSEIESELKSLIQDILKGIDTLSTERTKAFISKLIEKVVPIDEKEILIVLK